MNFLITDFPANLVVFDDAPEAGDDVLLVPGEEGDYVGVRVLGVTRGGGGAGPEARHLPPTAAHRHREVVERNLLRLNHIVLVA